MTMLQCGNTMLKIFLNECGVRCWCVLPDLHTLKGDLSATTVNSIEKCKCDGKFNVKLNRAT